MRRFKLIFLTVLDTDIRGFGMASPEGPAGVTASKGARTPKCARCRNHGFVVQLKGHSGKCRFRQCSCWKCSLINERTKILASQRRIKSVQGREPPGADGETVTAGSNGARPESVTRDGSCGDAHTVHCEPKTPAGARAPGDSPPFPGEYISFPGQMYPPEMFAIPLPLQPHFPDRCMFPAVLVSLRPPAPGAFREHVGFVPLPHGALSHPLETREWQIHVPQYSPYLPYPGLRDEHSHYSLCHMNGEQGRSEVPPPAANVPESQVGANQETDEPVENLCSSNTP